jgi:DNA polymerase-3 subunit beta
LDDEECEVNIKLSDSKIKFSFKEVTLVSKLIDGNFPEYQNLIPVDNEVVMEVDKGSLIESIDRVSTVNFDRSRSVKFLVDKSNLVLSVISEEHGEAKEVISCRSNIENFEIGFNARYLIDLVSAIESNIVVFSFNDTYSSAIIRDMSQDSYLFVIMPVRI